MAISSSFSTTTQRSLPPSLISVASSSSPPHICVFCFQIIPENLVLTFRRLYEEAVNAQIAFNRSLETFKTHTKVLLLSFFFHSLPSFLHSISHLLPHSFRIVELLLEERLIFCLPLRANKFISGSVFSFSFPSSSSHISPQPLHSFFLVS